MRAIHQGSNQNQGNTENMTILFYTQLHRRTNEIFSPAGYSALEDDVRIGQNFPGKLISSAETSKAVDTESNSARKDIPNFALSNGTTCDKRF